MKETISKGERQLWDWEKILVNKVTDNKLTSKICEQLIMFNTRKISDPIKKWAKGINRDFSKGDIQILSKHMKSCSTSLIIRYMQNQYQNEVPSHTGQSDYHQNFYIPSMQQKVWRKGNLLTLLIRMQTSTGTLENPVDIP